ncbi:MAG: diphthine--ammonia ligase [archaeon]
MKLAALFTGGKDSTYAIHLAKQQGHEIVCLISLKSENQASYMFHTPAIELTELQAEAMRLPILFFPTKGEKEKELVDLENAIVESRKKFEFEGLITGALFSEYQSSRIQTIADKLGLTVVSPLWHKSQEDEMQELLDNNFEIIFTAVAAYGLDKSWLNKVITLKDLNKLKKLKDKIGSNVAGEGGEFESLVLDCPLFKQRLVIEEFKIIEEAEHTARVIVKKAKLFEK